MIMRQRVTYLISFMSGRSLVCIVLSIPVSFRRTLCRIGRFLIEIVLWNLNVLKWIFHAAYSGPLTGDIVSNMVGTPTVMKRRTWFGESRDLSTDRKSGMLWACVYCLWHAYWTNSFLSLLFCKLFISTKYRILLFLYNYSFTIWLIYGIL